jgi:acetate---CoA ligase (ADP-forming)
VSDPVSGKGGIVQSLMNPKSIAVVGASQRMSRGTLVLLNLRKAGFGGAAYGINPRYDEVEGFPCYPSVRDVPDEVDCVVAAIPAAGVPDALEEAYSAGVRAAVVLSSGFGEGGHADDERVARLRDLAAGGMAICGPNCYGLLNLHTGAAPWSGRVAEPLAKGNVGLVSQSGGFSNVIADPLMEDRGVGFSYLVSCGNQIGTTVEDYLEYLVEDEQTKVVAAFVEGVRQPDKLVTVAARARELGKPIIVLKSGRSEVGKQAARSHTGSLSGSTEILDSLLRRHGYVVVGEIDQMIETIALFSVLDIERPISRDLIVITGSGGEGSHAADAAEDAGIGFAQLDEGLKQRLAAALPDFGAASNPIDGTGAMFENPDLFPSLFDAVLADNRNDLIAVNLGARKPKEEWAPMRSFAKTVAAASAGTGKVVVTYGTSALGTDDRLLVDTVHQAGIPFLAGSQRAMRAIASLYEYQQHRARAVEEHGPRPEVPVRTDLPGGVLPFLTARELLTPYGIPVVDTELATTADEAVAAAERLGYPVVLKIEAAGLTHKSDAGGVVLGCRDGAAVRDAYDRIVANVREAGYFQHDGVLVQPMPGFVAETFAGVTVDPILGPAVVFGLGGVFVEIIRDTVTATVPLSLSQARDMVLGIRGGQILRGARGREPADVEAVAELLVGLGHFADAYRDRLVSVDVNPVMVRTAGSGAVAVDLLVELRDGPA